MTLILPPGPPVTAQSLAPTNANLGAASGTNRISSAADLGKYFFGQEYLYTLLGALAAGTVTNWTLTESGDSTTVGQGILNPAYAPTTQLATLLNDRGISCTTTNAGHSGAPTLNPHTYNSALSNVAGWLDTYLPADLAGTRPNVYIMRWGMNDIYYGMPVSETINNIRVGLQTALAAWPTNSTSFLLCTPNTSSDDAGGRTEAWHEQLSAGFAQAARDFGVAFFDIYQFLRTARQTVTRGAAGNWLDGAYVHPNDAHENLIQGQIVDILFPQAAVAMSVRAPRALTPGTGFTNVSGPQQATSKVVGRNGHLTGYIFQSSAVALTSGQTVATIAWPQHRPNSGLFFMPAYSWLGAGGGVASNWETVPVVISAGGLITTMKASSNVCSRLYFDNISFDLFDQ